MSKLSSEPKEAKRSDNCNDITSTNINSIIIANDSNNKANKNKNNNGHLQQERKKNKKIDKVQCDGRL